MIQKKFQLETLHSNATNEEAEMSVVKSCGKDEGRTKDGQLPGASN